MSDEVRAAIVGALVGGLMTAIASWLIARYQIKATREQSDRDHAEQVKAAWKQFEREHAIQLEAAREDAQREHAAGIVEKMAGHLEEMAKAFSDGRIPRFDGNAFTRYLPLFEDVVRRYVGRVAVIDGMQTLAERAKEADSMSEVEAWLGATNDGISADCERAAAELRVLADRIRRSR